MANIDKHVDIYYRYAVLGQTLEQIGNAYTMTWGEISSILKQYQITGGKNNIGNWNKGSNCGKYKSGKFVIKADNGELEIAVTKPAIKEYMQNMKTGQSIEDYYKAKHTKVKVSPAKVVAVVVVSMVCLSVINPMDLISRNIKGKADKSFTEELKDVAIDEVKGEIKDTVEDEIVTEITEKSSGIKDYFSGEYKLEAYKCDDYIYIGDRRFNKPDSICFKTKDWAGYEIGNFSMGKLSDGEYVKYDDGILTIGVTKHGELDGWCLEADGKTIRFYEYSKGKKGDKGLILGEEYLSYNDFRDDTEIAVWASYKDDWQASGVSGLSKLFKTWKPDSIEYVDGKVKIDNSEYKYDFDKNKITYKGDEIEFSGTADKFKYTNDDTVIYSYSKNKYIKAETDDGEQCKVTSMD